MIGFLLKKTFYDGWDNMIRLVLVNLGFLASLGAALFLASLVPVVLLAMLVLAGGILWCGVYLCAAALSLKAISDHGSFGFADFFANIKAGAKAGLALGAACVALVAMAWQSIPFYLALESMSGFLLAAIVFWAFMLALVSFQFFFAVRARLDTSVKKIFRKCLYVFFDNPGFSIFCLLHTIVTLILSVFLALLLPGPAAALLFTDEALRLRLLKYDWLEANPQAPGARRVKIPWDAILIGEREKIGTRTFRNFIFPWKD